MELSSEGVVSVGVAGVRRLPDGSFATLEGALGQRDNAGPEADVRPPFDNAESEAWPRGSLGSESVSLPEDVEAKLIERILLRDEHAFTELMKAYQGRVYGLILRMLGNSAEAEEVAQEVFIQVFKSIGSFRGDSKFSTWIYRVAVNHCKNRVKYLKVRHSKQQDELEAVAERMPLGDGRRANVGQIERPDEALAGRQVERIVQESIAQIDPSFRECLILRDVEELSYEEIEAITGLAAGTVKSRIFRARAQLRELVEKRLGEKIG